MTQNEKSNSPVSRDEAGGESQGGHYPNPHDGKPDAQKDYDGGQSGKAYHGHGQLGEQDIENSENANAPSKED